jgi:molecular chaperone GrpE
MPDTMEDQGSATALELECSKLQTENESLRDRLLRALADAENTRRRAERAVADARQYAIADFARELLSVADNLQRAIVAAESEAGESTDVALLEGVRATERILMTAFERFGIRKIDALGARFDPALHEAMMELDDPSHPPGTVVQVMEDGYMIRDRLLRSARVVVAKRPSQPSPSASAAAPLVPDDAPTTGQE